MNDVGDPKDDFGPRDSLRWHNCRVINNSVGIAGLAQVKIMAEKVLDDRGYGFGDWIASGIIHAVNKGAHIISMSLGGYGYSQLLHEAVKYVYENGALLVAAGNDNARVAIKGSTAQIQTTLGIVNGTVAEIKANMASIVVPGLGQIQTDVSGLVGMQETLVTLQYLIMAFSLVAAISAVLSAALLMKSKRSAKT